MGAGLFWVVIVVTLGARTVEGAVQAGAALKLFPELLKAIGVSLTWHPVLFGLGALTFARHPEGIAEHGKRTSLAGMQRLLDRARRARPVATPAAAPPPS